MTNVTVPATSSPVVGVYERMTRSPFESLKRNEMCWPMGRPIMWSGVESANVKRRVS